MTTAASAPARPDYGVDAPGVIRNLTIGTVVWSGHLGDRGPWLAVWNHRSLPGVHRPHPHRSRPERLVARAGVRPDGVLDGLVQPGREDPRARAAIHNIYSEDGRAKAIREIARVLRPGGQALIDDIRHLRQYAKEFSDNDCAVRRTTSRAYAALFAVTIGSLHPGTLLARKVGP